MRNIDGLSPSNVDAIDCVETRGTLADKLGKKVKKHK